MLQVAQQLNPTGNVAIETLIVSSAAALAACSHSRTGTNRTNKKAKEPLEPRGYFNIVFTSATNSQKCTSNNNVTVLLTKHIHTDIYI